MSNQIERQAAFLKMVISKLEAYGIAADTPYNNHPATIGDLAESILMCGTVNSAISDVESANIEAMKVMSFDDFWNDAIEEQKRESGE